MTREQVDRLYELRAAFIRDIGKILSCDEGKAIEIFLKLAQAAVIIGIKKS